MEAPWPHAVPQQATVSSFSRWTPKVETYLRERQTWGFMVASLREEAPPPPAFIKDVLRVSAMIMMKALCRNHYRGGVGGVCALLVLLFLSVYGRPSSKYLTVTFLSFKGTVTDVEAAFERFSNPTVGAAEVIYAAFSAASVCGSICSGLSLSLMVLSRHVLVYPQNTTLIILSNRSCPSEKWPRATRKQSQCGEF